MNDLPVSAYETADLAPPDPRAAYFPRPPYLPLLLLPGTLLCGVSWIAGGQPRLTDAGFFLFSLICFLLLLMEVANFPRRYGIGGMILFGGALVWLSHDYFSHWFGVDAQTFAQSGFAPAVIAKAAFYNCLFVMLMSAGLLIRKGRWFERIIMSVPEPHDTNLYFYITIGMQCVGLLAFVCFAAEPAWLALFHAATGAFTGQGVRWSVGRSGNLNYNWGGYVAQILQIGQTGAVVAAVYAILIARAIPPKLVAWSIWAFWVMYALAGGRRGEMVFLFLPVAFLLYLKHQALASSYFPRHSLKAYLLTGGAVFVLLVIVQVEGTFRDVGLGNADLSQVDLTRSQGNTMFTEGLTGWAAIPDQLDFYYDRVPGESWVRVIPDQIFDFFVGVIPRALWHDKPVDPVWAWYNAFYMKGGSGVEGTTISDGLAGHWYFRYGMAGIVEGALLMGWLLGAAERSLQSSDGRPMTILLSLGVATWLFRCFRDFIFIDLYGLLIGAVAFVLLCRLANMFSGDSLGVGQEGRQAPLV